MIVPSEAPSFSEAMRQGSEVYQKLKTLAKKKYGQSAGNVGDEGGVAPNIHSADEALDLITSAIKESGHSNIKIAMDAASSEFYDSDEKKYDLDFKNPEGDKSKTKINYEQLAKMYQDMADKVIKSSTEKTFQLKSLLVSDSEH